MHEQRLPLRGLEAGPLFDAGGGGLGEGRHQRDGGEREEELPGAHGPLKVAPAGG